MMGAASHANGGVRKNRGRLGLILLASLVLGSRLLWIGDDYGADPDCYRVINAARQIAHSGRYVESRLPGYPVQEYALSLLVRGGPVASNGLTAVFSVGASLLFALILRKAGVQDHLLGSVAFALTPIVYISSTCSIDYIWAVAFVLGATHAVLLERPVLAGCLLGLGIGCRITSAAMVPLLGGLVLATGRPELRRRGLAFFMGAAAAVGFLCYAPVMLRHGLAFLTFAEPAAYPPLNGVLSRATTGVWGTVGAAAAVGVGVALAAGKFRPPPRKPHARRLLRFCFVVVLVYTAIYARLPLESGYLIPAVPFALIGLGLVSPGPLFRAFCLALCVSPFMEVGRSGISLGGRTASDRAARRDGGRTAQAVIDIASRLGDGIVIVCGSLQPRILSMVDSMSPDGRRYVYLVRERTTLERYAAEGYRIFFVTGAEAENLALYGLDLRSAGAQELRPLP
jgi:hypothetical protein